jgi:hypothetical protein
MLTDEERYSLAYPAGVLESPSRTGCRIGNEVRGGSRGTVGCSVRTAG